MRPGGAYAGGTLARDVSYLIEQGEARGCTMPLFRGVRDSNDVHRGWAYDALVRLLGPLAGHSIAVLGLTYKPGTDTLRRSPAVDLCLRLVATGARVIAYDPAVKTLPRELAASIELADTAHDALRGASAAVIATEWPEFRTLDVPRHSSAAGSEADRRRSRRVSREQRSSTSRVSAMRLWEHQHDTSGSAGDRHRRQPGIRVRGRGTIRR